MKSFEYFEVELKLGTPLIPSQYPIMLDGLLYYMIAEVHRLNPQEDIEQVLSLLDEVLVKHELGFYHASQAQFVRDAIHGINTGIVAQPTCMYWQDYPHALKKSIVTKSGKYRSRMTKNNTVSPLALRFFGYGDLQMCTYFLNQVAGVGRSHNQGHGEVIACHIKSIDADLSLMDEEGQLNRPLPKLFVEGLGVGVEDYLLENRNLRPPYPISLESTPHFLPKQKVVFI